MNVETERLRDYLSLMTNTDIWQDFAVRPDDIFVVTPPKCGTTWTLSIVMMLIHGGVVPEAGNRNEAPWLDCAFRDRQAIAAAQAALTRRRCIKSHTPLDGISYGAGPSYITVYRHPIDVYFSFRSHVSHMKDPSRFAELVPDDIRAGFARFVEAGTDDLTLASIVHHYTQSRARAAQGNVHFFHYADLSRDHPGQIARLAELLGIDLAPEVLAGITRATTFASMRAEAEASDARYSEASPFTDHSKFFAAGTSNKWDGQLTSDDLARYDARLASLLPPEGAAWLNWGSRGAP